jgi:hypothetical protein
VFENWVLRRIFRPKRDEMTESWRKMHDEELYTVKVRLSSTLGEWGVPIDRFCC